MEDPDSRVRPGSLDRGPGAGVGTGPVRTRRAALREWLRAAGSPLMVGLLVLVLVVGGAFVRLGFWQLDRAGIRGQEAAQVERAERLEADPVPIEDVLAPQTALTADDVGRPVSLSGTYAADEEVLVPGRQVGGVDAVMVVTALHLTEGPHAGAIMPVVRGWLPSEELAATRLEAGGAGDGGVADVVVPAAPAGTVDVVGVLNAGEAAGDAPLAPGQVGAISPAQLTNLWGGPMFSAYLVAEEPRGAALEAAPPPGLDVDAGLNLQSLAYAFEWWIFAAFAVFMWMRILRDQVHQRREP